MLKLIVSAPAYINLSTCVALFSSQLALDIWKKNMITPLKETLVQHLLAEIKRCGTAFRIVFCVPPPRTALSTCPRLAHRQIVIAVLFVPKGFGRLPKITISRTYTITNKGLFYYEGTLWSNCKQMQSSEWRFSLCKKYELLLRSLCSSNRLKYIYVSGEEI